MFFFEWIARDEDVSPDVIEMVEYLKAVLSESEFPHFSDVTLTKCDADVANSDGQDVRIGIFTASEEPFDTKEDPDRYNFCFIVRDNPRRIVIGTNRMDALKRMGYLPEEVQVMSLYMERFCTEHFSHLGKLRVLHPNLIDFQMTVNVDEQVRFFPEILRYKQEENEHKQNL